jgi:hypothetical protein
MPEQVGGQPLPGGSGHETSSRWVPGMEPSTGAETKPDALVNHAGDREPPPINGRVILDQRLWVCTPFGESAGRQG